MTYRLIINGLVFQGLTLVQLLRMHGNELQAEAVRETLNNMGASRGFSWIVYGFEVQIDREN